MGVVKEEFRDGVYNITFNRPEKRNAMDLEVLTAFWRALRNAQEKKVPVVVLRGAGNTFTAGGGPSGCGTEFGER